MIKIKKVKNKFELLIRVENKNYIFYSMNDNKSNIYNILATLTSINLFEDLSKMDKDIFLNLKSPEGRGDISKIKIKNKYINLVDESYNSNPLSLKTAIENFDKILTKKSKKYIVLGDMLELGKHSFKQHKLISRSINKSNIHKVYVHGKFIKETFKGLIKIRKQKYSIESQK